MIKVLVADDQPLMREAMRIFVDRADDMTVVGEAGDGAVALTQVRTLRPDVVLMDMQMPVMDGVEATRQITEEFPETRVLAVTTFSSEQYLVPALRAGASGYLVKDAEPEEFVDGVRDIHAGAGAFSRGVARDLIEAVRATSRKRVMTRVAAHERLNDREQAIVDLLAQGKSNAEIGADLGLAEATVKANLGKIMAKWQVRDRVQVLIHAARLGLVDIVR
ncbi:response regulator transcription factor [Sediminivirga luteola]|uniref:DNA-binding response regulator n=1 Tax=Sediminivirga luteola TaxID=1774748 RepID=A0A8J2TX75_9MICO|nr:response regulator transcription factor [Sediminivirga luteola]MCI2265488.1 response regulator transcription factor [Sediminivirga luteola]GGA10230.1 DNA-binding response regulator [Sediminivirga luteola]